MKSSERLEKILKHLKISANKLSVEIGLKDNTKIYHIKKDRNDISPEMAKIPDNKCNRVFAVL
jgi:plasmid maintenance system antidote protein VapI